MINTKETVSERLRCEKGLFFTNFRSGTPVRRQVTFLEVSGSCVYVGEGGSFINTGFSWIITIQKHSNGRVVMLNGGLNPSGKNHKNMSEHIG